MVLSVGQELRGIQFSTCSSRGCWMGSLLSEAPGAELSCLSKFAHPSQEANQQGWLLVTVQIFPAKH